MKGTWRRKGSYLCSLLNDFGTEKLILSYSCWCQTADFQLCLSRFLQVTNMQMNKLAAASAHRTLINNKHMMCSTHKQISPKSLPVALLSWPGSPSVVASLICPYLWRKVYSKNVKSVQEFFGGRKRRIEWVQNDSYNWCSPLFVIDDK